jgi:hypothetical protein
VSTARLRMARWDPGPYLALSNGDIKEGGVSVNKGMASGKVQMCVDGRTKVKASEYLVTWSK